MARQCAAPGSSWWRPGALGVTSAGLPLSRWTRAPPASARGGGTGSPAWCSAAQSAVVKRNSPASPRSTMVSTHSSTASCAEWAAQVSSQVEFSTPAATGANAVGAFRPNRRHSAASSAGSGVV